MANLIGKQFGNYRLIRLLGEGGFAEVYLGEHIHLETQAAIKILETRLARDDIETFRIEARTVARLVHPHIVRVLEFGVEGRTPFLVMDYAPNGTLRQSHPKCTPLPLATIVSYVKQVADALQYAHDEKLIHRDVKPENMLVDRRKAILLSDFGIAIAAQSSRRQSTQDNAGTIAYMAPEQLQGKPRPASDQYSLAIVVYEWLCGERPFRGSYTEIYSQQMHVPPPSLCERLPSVPAAVEEVVFTALAKGPKDRFASISAFANALEQADLSKLPSLTVPLPEQTFKPTVPNTILPAPVPPVQAPVVAAPATINFTEQVSIAPGPQVVNGSLLKDILLQENAGLQSADSVRVENIHTPKLIKLPQPPDRVTANTPPPVIVPAATPPPNVAPVQTPRRQSIGKVAAVGIAGRVARPPTIAHPAGTRVPPRRVSRLLVILAVLIVLILLVGGIASTSGILGHLGGIVPGVPPSATVTITPASSDLKKTYVIFGVTGNPDSSQRQVQARLLSSTTLPQVKTVPATGVVQTPGTQARGTITFYNGVFVSQQVLGGTTFNLAGGLQIITDQTVNIPAAAGTPPNVQDGSASVSAHASSIGPGGNIAALTINGACCATDGSIFAKNLNAFTGGQDPQNYAVVVQQSDIDGAANPLVSVLTPEAQKSLNGQIHPNEHLVAPGVQCTPNVTSDHKAGDKATTVMVTVKVTCSAEVYDQQGAQRLAANLLRQEAAKRPGAGFALLGNLVIAVTEVTVTDTQKGTLSLLVKTEGVWVFQFSDVQKQNLAKLLAGKSENDAQTALLQQSGVAKVDIQLNGNTLPTDPNKITIVVLNVPGLTVSGTPTAGSSPTTGAGTSAPSTPTAPTVVPSTGLGGS